MWDHFPTYPHFPINQVDGSKWIHMFDLTLILHQMALLPLFHVPKYYIRKIAIKSSDKKILDAHCFQSFSVNSVLKTTKINWHAHTTDGSTCLIWHGFCTRWPQPSTFLGLEWVTSLWRSVFSELGNVWNLQKRAGMLKNIYKWTIRERESQNGKKYAGCISQSLG